MKTTIQTENIDLSSGTSAGFYEFIFRPKIDYKTVDAIEIVEISNGGDTKIEAGLFDVNGEVESMQPLSLWKHRGGGYYEGLKKTQLIANNYEYRLKVKTSTSLTSDLALKICLYLSKE